MMGTTINNKLAWFLGSSDYFFVELEILSLLELLSLVEVLDSFCSFSSILDVTLVEFLL